MVTSNKSAIRCGEHERVSERASINSGESTTNSCTNRKTYTRNWQANERVAQNHCHFGIRLWHRFANGKQSH